MAYKRHERTTSSLLPEFRTHHRVLPWEEQLALLEEHHASKNEETRRRIEETLLLHNIGFIKKKLKEMNGGSSNHKISHDEKFLKVCWEYVVAIRKYDPQKGARLNTYAAWWIRKSDLETRRELDRSSSVIHIPIRVQQQLIAVRKFGNTPAKKIAATMGIPEDEVRFLQRLDTFMGELDAFMQDTSHHSNEFKLPRGASLEQTTFPNALEVAMKRDLLRFILENLKERERTTLILRTRGITLQEIGERFGVSRERIRQIERDAKIRARRFACQYNAPEKSAEIPEVKNGKRTARKKRAKTSRKKRK